MNYNKKPKMILFDVGGTLFEDGRCNPAQGFEKLRLSALNPDVTTAEKLAEYWDIFLNEVSGFKSKSSITLDVPLSAVIRYATMHTGLIFDIPMAQQEEIFDRYNSTRKVLDGIPELLDKLDSLGIRTAIISNNMMSGESLSLAVKRWIPNSNFEFCLTSADILFTKPSSDIFACALSYAALEPDECWYCGDSKIPDVYGSSRCGMTPVLIYPKAEMPLEYRSDNECEGYLVINHWNVLTDFLASDVKER